MGYFDGDGYCFLSIVTTVNRPVSSATSWQCWLVQDYQEALKKAGEWLSEHRFTADDINIFSKPRLCERCMEHAVQPLLFDYARFPEECICKMEGTPCGIHSH